MSEQIKNRIKNIKRLTVAIVTISIILLLVVYGVIGRGNIGLLTEIILVAIFTLILYLCYRFNVWIDNIVDEHLRTQANAMISHRINEKRLKIVLENSEGA
ncbi:MAG: hypothetical protein FWE05_12690 [Defluviitaleaceae bacterium]|nr:hypothetical protein [Defluviitaleaceae bacterium]